MLFKNCVAFLAFPEQTFFLIYKAGKSGLSGQFLEMNMFTRIVDLNDSLQWHFVSAVCHCLY